MRWIISAFALAACSSSATRPPAPPESHAGARGDACIAGPFKTSTCGDGMLCFPTPGGYCTSFCSANGDPCPDGTCMDTGRGGAVCARTCASDADCRASEGYACDPVWHACSLPGMSAPRPPACHEAALAKRAFGAAQQLTDDKTPGVYQFEPSAVALADGSIVAVYTTGDRMGAPNVPRVVVIDPRGAAHDAALPRDREHAIDAWLARDSRGTLHAVWLAFDGPGAPEKRMEIAYATSRDGGATWSAPAAAHDPLDCPDGMPGCLDKPMIAVGPGDTIYVAYATEADGREGLRLRASHDGGATWSASVAVMDASYGDLAIDASGAIHVVGANGSPKSGAFGAVGQTIDYTVSTDGGAHFAPVVHVNGDGESIPFFFVNPGVEVDAARKTIYVAYARGGADAAWDIVLAASKDGGATWTHTVVDRGGRCARAVPMIALDPASGRVHVAWLDDRDGRGALAYAVCEPGGARCGAEERASDAPFAAFSFVRHGAPWMGEYASLVIDGAHRALHAVWTQPVATPAGPASRLFHASAPL